MLTEYIPVSLAGVGSREVIDDVMVTEGVLTVLDRMGTIVPASMAIVGVIDISTASVNRSIPLYIINNSNLDSCLSNHFFQNLALNFQPSYNTV